MQKFLSPVEHHTNPIRRMPVMSLSLFWKFMYNPRHMHTTYYTPTHVCTHTTNTYVFLHAYTPHHVLYGGKDLVQTRLDEEYIFPLMCLFPLAVRPGCYLSRVPNTILPSSLGCCLITRSPAGGAAPCADWSDCLGCPGGQRVTEQSGSGSARTQAVVAYATDDTQAWRGPLSEAMRLWHRRPM